MDYINSQGNRTTVSLAGGKNSVGHHTHTISGLSGLRNLGNTSRKNEDKFNTLNESVIAESILNINSSLESYQSQRELDKINVEREINGLRNINSNYNMNSGNAKMSNINMIHNPLLNIISNNEIRKIKQLIHSQIITNNFISRIKSPKAYQTDQ
jgi:hypothetical protein